MCCLVLWLGCNKASSVVWVMMCLKGSNSKSAVGYWSQQGVSVRSEMLQSWEEWFLGGQMEGRGPTEHQVWRGC